MSSQPAHAVPRSTRFRALNWHNVLVCLLPAVMLLTVSRVFG